MKITIVEAVKAGYSTKPTIYRDLKKGNLTASKNKRGANVVDVTDLIKLYGEPVAPTEAKANKGAAKPQGEIKALQAELAAVKAELEQAKHEAMTSKHEAQDERTSAKEERERLYGLVENSQKLIEDMSKTGQKGFLGKLFGK